MKPNPSLFVLALAAMAAMPAAADDAPSYQFAAASKSLPLWTEAPESETLDLSQLVQQLHPSIFLVGTADGGHGTAFVISQENRLLATNAHVADIMHAAGGQMLAIGNGTARVYQVDAVYYHPGVRRVLGNMAVRTSDPARGDVYPESPDVAVLHLADGEELPPALVLADPDELNELLAKPIAMLGYPGHDTESWPSVGQKAEATFRQGVVCRMTDFMNDVNAPSNELQFMQHSMANWFGFSGSPIFLKNGHVIALNNCGTTKKKGNLITSLAWGVRVDCLWELLKQHGLWSQVAISADPSTVDVERFSQPDPTEAAFNQARRLVAQARIDLMRKDELEAVRKCNEASRIMPHLTAIYDARCIAYNFYANHKINARNAEAERYFQYALDDAKRAAELEPGSIDHYLDVAMGEINVANVKVPLGSFHQVPAAVELADELIAEPAITARDRAYAYRVRAFANAWAPEVLADLEKAVETDPWIPQNYMALSTYWTLHRNGAKQREAKAKADALSAAIADSDQAWLAATSRDDDHRNGHDAQRLAKLACEATNYKWWGALRSLAAAHAELGEFDEAAKYADQAAKLAPENESGAITRQLRSYRQQEPWRED